MVAATHTPYGCSARGSDSSSRAAMVKGHIGSHGVACRRLHARRLARQGRKGLPGWRRGGRLKLSDCRSKMRLRQGRGSSPEQALTCPGAPYNDNSFLISFRLSFPDAETAQAAMDEAVTAQTFDRLWDTLLVET